MFKTFQLATPMRRATLATIIVLGTALPLARPALSANAETQRNETIVREAFQRWSAGEYIFPSLLASDVVWTIHGSGPVAGTYRSMTDFVERASQPLVSRLVTMTIPQVHHIWAVDDRVIMRFDASATTTLGRPYRNQFVWIFRMKEGLVAEAEAFLDLAAYQKVVDENPPRQQ
jgi:uncharacterized protein